MSYHFKNRASTNHSLCNFKCWTKLEVVASLSVILDPQVLLIAICFFVEVVCLWGTLERSLQSLLVSCYSSHTKSTCIWLLADVKIEEMRGNNWLVSHFLYNVLFNLWVWGKVSIIFKSKSTSKVTSHRGIEPLSFAAVSVRVLPWQYVSTK